MNSIRVLNLVPVSVLVLILVLVLSIHNVSCHGTSDCNINDKCDINKHTELAACIPKIHLQLKQGKLNEYSCRMCYKLICLLKKCVDTTAKWMFIIKWYCNLRSDLSDKSICGDMSKLYAPHLYFIFKHSKLTAEEMCAVLLTDRCVRNTSKISLKLPLPTAPKRYDYHIRTKPKRILHISDIHYDPYYQVDSIANCDKATCCRRDSQVNDCDAEHIVKAGYWGQSWPQNRKIGICDTPLQLIENIFDYINRSERVDYIFWTGDTTVHIPISSKELILETISKVTQLLSKYFNNSIIFPALGNHDCLPNSQYPIVNYVETGTSKMYEQITNLWYSHNWLPTNRSMALFSRGGYYSRIVHNIKVIVLNTNHCVRRNFWTLYDPIDPGLQLKWLINELWQTEKMKQKAVIIGHHPPSYFLCIENWIRNYLRILDRFQMTIIGTFFGHTHKDEIRVYYSKKGKPTAYGLTAPDFIKYNPAFRIYSLNDKGHFKDAETYFANITQLNAIGQHAKVKFKKLYSMRDQYGIKLLTADEIHKLYQRIVHNDTLAAIYYNNSHRLSSTMKLICDTKCKRKLIFDSIAIQSNTNGAQLLLSNYFIINLTLLNAFLITY